MRHRAKKDQIRPGQPAPLEALCCPLVAPKDPNFPSHFLRDPCQEQDVPNSRTSPHSP